MNRPLIILILVLVTGFYQYWGQREVAHPQGVLVSETPIQKDTKAGPIKYKNVVLDPLAEYALKARVLSTERYWIDKMSRIVPVDVALGWGAMSDTKVLDGLRMWQEGRFYFYAWREAPPIDPQIITKSSANMHLIPSTEYVEQEIKKLRKGQIVDLRGYLVRINFPDGSDAKSSLAREDSGAGACEIMWVQSIQTF